MNPAQKQPTKMPPITLRTIAATWLADNGYDGLLGEYDCGCFLGNLFPCDNPGPDCTPGYKGPDPSGDCDFLIYATSEAAEAAKEQP